MSLAGAEDTRIDAPPVTSRTLALVVATALFMENMDGTILATALPTIATDLGVSPLSLKLALTSYLVSLAIFIPPSGWVADRFGARRVFAAAIAVFLIGSVACTLATGLGGFILARFLQGMGGAMMVPVGRLILARSVAKADLVGAMAWLTMPALVGPVVGPLLGGIIVTHADWRWIFLVNVPVGLIGIALALALLPRAGGGVAGRFDWAGFLLAAVALSCLMLGSMEVTSVTGMSGMTFGLLGAGVAAAAALVWQSLRSPAPMLNFRLLAIPTYRASVLGGTFFRIGVGAIPFLLPLMLQIGFGLSAVQSGALTFVAALGAFFMKPLNTRVLSRFGFRAVLAVNGVLAALSLGVIGWFTPVTPHALIYAVLFVGGCMRSLQFTSLNAIAYADLSQAQMSGATSLSAMAQQVSVGLGVTIGAAILAVSMRAQGATDLAQANWAHPFLAVGLLALLSVPVFLRLPKTAGDAMAGRSIVGTDESAPLSQRAG